MKNAMLGVGLLSVGSVFAMVACSADAPPSTSEAEQTKEPAPATTTPATTTPATPAPAPAKTANNAQKTCVDGCVEDNTDGAKEFASLLVPCACQADVCGDVCTAGCAADADEKDLLSTASDACRECVVAALKPGGTCNAKLQAQCPKRASCVPFALCVQGCAK